MTFVTGARTESKRVFISSPYTVGDTAENVRSQHDAFNSLVSLGHIPFAPLLSHYQQLIHPMSWQEWMDWCLVWVGQCETVLRLPGVSKGADIECAWANELGIPVIFTYDQLVEHLIQNDQKPKEPLRSLSKLRSKTVPGPDNL